MPPDICSSLNKLLGPGSALPRRAVYCLGGTVLGQPIDALFAEFSSRTLSLRLHRPGYTGRLKSGEQVVIKAVRPGIEQTIHSDLKLMLVLARWVAALNSDGKRLKPVEVVEEYHNTILDELDLMREAANAAQLKRNFTPARQLYVPTMHWDYCRSNVLVMERIWGVSHRHQRLKRRRVDLKPSLNWAWKSFFTQVFDHNFSMPICIRAMSTSAPTDRERRITLPLDMAIMGSLTREDQYYLGATYWLCFAGIIARWRSCMWCRAGAQEHLGGGL